MRNPLNFDRVVYCSEVPDFDRTTEVIFNDNEKSSGLCGVRRNTIRSKTPCLLGAILFLTDLFHPINHFTLKVFLNGDV
jgi:hypothetical protein